ncbi:hypothetical protein ACFLWX_03140 [Chloroflexota bacterium]
MMVPPTLVRLRVLQRDKNVRLWFPLCILFPLVLAFALLLLPFVLLGVFVLWYSGWGKTLLLAGPAMYRLFCALRGLEIDIKQGSKGSERIFVSLK